MTARASIRPGQSLEAAEFFDVQAEHYDRAHDDAGASGEALRSRLAMTARLLGEGPGEVLDAGMGPGRLLTELAARGWTPAGVDASSEMVERARLKLPAAAERLCVGQIEDLPLGDASVDAVVATGVLEYSRDQRTALRELGRVLRPGGRAIVSCPNPRAAYTLWNGHVAIPLGRRYRRLLGRVALERPAGAGPVPRRRLEWLLAEAGLVVDAVEYTNFLLIPGPLDRLLPRTAVRAARLLEGSGPLLGRILATQMVFAAHRPRDAR